MIDDSDVNDALLWGMLSNGPFAFIFMILALVFMYFSCVNKEECATKQCPADMRPILTDHKCLCVTEAK